MCDPEFQGLMYPASVSDMPISATFPIMSNSGKLFSMGQSGREPGESMELPSKPNLSFMYCTMVMDAWNSRAAL